MAANVTTMPVNKAPSPAEDAWFTSLYEEHAPAIYRYFARRAARAECEDLTAEVFAIAWRKRADIGALATWHRDGVDGDGEEERGDVPDAAVKYRTLAWLYRTAGLLLANHRRKITAIPVAEVPDDVDLLGPELDVIRDEEVRAALARLSPRDRVILTLAAWEGLDPTQLAEVLGVSRGGADAALSRARARLRGAWPG